MPIRPPQGVVNLSTLSITKLHPAFRMCRKYQMIVAFANHALILWKAGKVHHDREVAILFERVDGQRDRSAIHPG